MIKHNAKWVFAILILGIYPLVLQAADIHGEMKALADSAMNMLGQKQLPAVNARWMKLAKQQNDTTQIIYAYNNLTSHYYQLGDIDSLQKYTYEYMDWCVKYNHSRERYISWRQYIQRMTEKGMQEEVMAETAKLHDDAKNAKG